MPPRLTKPLEPPDLPPGSNFLPLNTACTQLSYPATIMPPAMDPKNGARVDRLSSVNVLTPPIAYDVARVGSVPIQTKLGPPESPGPAVASRSFPSVGPPNG